MFNLGMGEITVILVLALLFIGPSKLPDLAAGLGKFIRQIRKTTADVKNEIVLDDSFRKPFEELRDAVTLAPEELNGSNMLELRVYGNDAHGQAVLVAKLDNLGKGASGAAVQNIGLMLGVDVAVVGKGASQPFRVRQQAEDAAVDERHAWRHGSRGDRVSRIRRFRRARSAASGAAGRAAPGCRSRRGCRRTPPA